MVKTNILIKNCRRHGTKNTYDSGLLKEMEESSTLLSAIKDWHVNHPKIKNVVLFVSDALRWDYLPKEIRSMGVTFKTVASGTFTPVSFASIISGLYQPLHGVYNFFSSGIDNVESLMNMNGYNSSFWTENIWTQFDPPTSAPIYNVAGCKNRVSLEDLKPPFIYLEDEKGGHSPYGWSFDDKEYGEMDCMRFHKDFGRKSLKELRAKYEIGVERSLNEFQKRLKIIERRGLWDETLVIFLADHGELLGEYGGIISHEYFTAPEVVYVPVVMVHPDLPKGLTFEHEGVLRHVDLYPTICSILGRKSPIVDGLSLLRVEKLPEFGFTYYVENGTLRKHEYSLEEISLWDKDGGHVFRTGLTNYQKLLRGLYFTLVSSDSPNPNAVYLRQRLRRYPWLVTNYVEALDYYCKSHIKYGSPSFKKEEAKLLIEKAKSDHDKARQKQKIRKVIKRMNEAPQIMVPNRQEINKLTRDRIP